MDLLKILVIGDGQVGKTSLLKTMSREIFEEEFTDISRTVVFDFHLLTFDDDKKVIFFDIAGQENEGIEIAIKGMTRFVLGGVHLILMVFDLNRLESLMNLSKWYLSVNTLYKEQDIDQPKILLIGNKSDLQYNVTMDMIDRLLSSNTNFCKFFITSCIDQKGIEEVRMEIKSYMENGSI